MTRREFLTWAGAGWVATSFPIALAACSPSTSTPTASTSTTSTSTTSTPTASTPTASPPAPGQLAELGTTGGDFEAVAELSDLQPGAAIETVSATSKKSIVITGDAKDLKSIAAVNPTCTHNGCATKWNAQSKQFVCPCHGSSFDANGNVTQGPAGKPLATYEVKVEKGKIMAKV